MTAITDIAYITIRTNRTPAQSDGAQTSTAEALREGTRNHKTESVETTSLHGALHENKRTSVHGFFKSPAAKFTRLFVLASDEHGDKMVILGQHDVLLGRKKRSHGHPGNRLFRELIQAFRQEYQESRVRRNKNAIVIRILETISGRGGKLIEGGTKSVSRTVTRRSATHCEVRRRPETALVLIVQKVPRKRFKLATSRICIA